MTSNSFIPFGDELKVPSNPQFVLHGDTKPETANDSTVPVPVTPAETHDLEAQIRQLLQDQLSEDSLDSTIDSIKAIVQSTPLPVALPEIKLHPLDAPPEGQPTIAFERDGDTVKRVQVNCSCGQSIHLDCVY